ncbi:MAG TPA: alpha/beta hydrolase [Caulobacteraceae bacterium]|nr:alpha/beta hydrolase [Caulobacteraceae bacterium]
MLVVPLVLAAAVTVSAATPIMTWPDLLGRPLPRPSERIAYGPDPLQVGELWAPAGKGPHPVVVMIHGGCWRTNIAKLAIMNYAAADLARRGIAVWNIEYRGIDRPGGGYPGTFQDVAAAADALVGIARAHKLETGRIVAVGHSAGGHLAFWLAARPSLPHDSPLWSAHPLPIAGVVSLGGVPDLTTAGQGCGDESVSRLVGRPSAKRPDVLADTSPAELAPRVAAVVISGEEDGVAPPQMARAFVAKMAARGMRFDEVVLPATGHVELIAPGTRAWDSAVGATERLLREQPRERR